MKPFAVNCSKHMEELITFGQHDVRLFCSYAPWFRSFIDVCSTSYLLAY